MKVLVTEPLAQDGLDLLCASHDVTVDLRPSGADLKQMIGNYDALVVRSSTQVTAEVLECAEKLRIIGRAGTGVDNIDVPAATRRGILVVNAPTSNTIAVAEHAMGLMLSLSRHIAQADQTMHCGLWDKKAFMGHELRHKTLGLVGLGRVGRAVAARANAFDMHVMAFDPFISIESAKRMNVEMAKLDDLLTQADYISLHAPSTSRTRGMIGARELAMIKPTAYLINCARGDLIVEEDLIEALNEGQIAGAGLDVFTAEPAIDPRLCACPNLLLTPHLGASTEEAQSGAAAQVARQVVDVLDGGVPRYPVNVTALPPEELQVLTPFLDLGRRMGRFYAQFAGNHLREIELSYAGRVTDHDTTLITASILTGLLAEAGHESVNLINASVIAKERGLMVSEMRTAEAESSSSLITLHTHTSTTEHYLAGTIIRNQPHMVRIDNCWVDFVPRGALLVEENDDIPGVVGRVGIFLGDKNVNISFVELGRQTKGGQAIMILGVDEPISKTMVKEVERIRGVNRAHAIQLDE